MIDWWLKHAFLLALMALALMAGGCTRTVTVVETVEVFVPVATPCIKADDPVLRPREYQADRAPTDQSIYPQAQTLLADREQRKATELELRAALEGCAAN